ncbi:MAG: hypothetical protein JXA66_00595 [Oligoflexia bacterium]|nr:hypothetical protein [Oligoflexia bacterium]
MKKTLIVLLALFFTTSCGSSLDWTLLFEDNFTDDFRVGAHTYNDTGILAVSGGEAVCQGSNCGVEYEGTGDSPDSAKIKMSLKFKISEAFDTDFDRVGVFDPNDLGGDECAHFAGVVYLAGSSVLAIVADEDAASPVASTAVTLTPDTYYYLEFTGNDGELTATLKDVSGNQIEQVSGSVASGCIYKEASFGASDEESAGLSITMDDFEVYISN